MKNVIKISKITSILILVLFFSACGSKKESEKSSTTLEAYRLIDEHRTDEAIELLESALAKEPSNTEYKSVLASAYAHKAGIKIQTLVPILSKADKLKKLNQINFAANGDTASSKVNAGAISIAAMLAKFSGVFETYASVPIVSKDQSAYLIHAIYLLNEIGTQVKPEDVLYRAILEIVLFKHYLAEGFIGEFIEPQTKDEQTCRLDLGNVNDSIIKMGKLLIDIFNDIGFANPKQAEDMKKLAVQTSDSVSNLTIATTTVTVIDEAANIFLRQAAIQNGFGKIIKCGGK